MARLLAAQARRRGFLRLPVWTVMSTLLCLAPASLASLRGQAHGLEARTFVYVFTLAVAILVPLGQLLGDAVLLAGLRRGRCLEDILGTRTRAREIVDQVAAFSVRSVWQMGLAAAAPLLAGLWLVVPPDNRFLMLGCFLAWFPLAALLVLVGSYVVQASSILRRNGDSGLATALFLGLVVTGAVTTSQNHSLLLTVVLAGVLGALGLGARWLALRGLARAGLPYPPVRPGVGARTAPARAPKDRHENPIALREEARRLGSLPFPGLQRLGPARVLMARHWPVWLGLAFLLVYRAGGNADVAQGLGLGLGAVVVFLQPLFASLQTAAAIVQEREGGTLEALTSTGLEPRTFVDGWARAAWGPRLLETLLILGGVLLVLGTLRNGLPHGGYLLIYLPDALGRLFLGAYLGLVVSCLAKARRDAWVLLVLLWVALQMALSMASGILLAAWGLLANLAGLSSEAMATPHGPVLLMGGYLAATTLICLVATLGLRRLAIHQVAGLFSPRRQGGFR